MSRNYTHSRLSRNNIGRKKPSRKFYKFYLFLIMIIIVLIFLTRDITPNKVIIEKNITELVKAGEFDK